MITLPAVEAVGLTIDPTLLALLGLTLAGVVVRGKKLWLDFWCADLQPSRCREPTGLDNTPDNRKKAVAHLDEIRAQIRRGTFEYAQHFPRSNRLDEVEEKGESTFTKKTLLGRYMVRWLAARSPLRADNSVVEDAEIHPTTWLHDKGVVQRHIAPELGVLSLDEITPGVAIDFRRSLERELIDEGGRVVRKPLRAKTVNNILSVLRTALEEAVGRGLIERNPVVSYRRRRRKLRADPQPLAQEEVQALLAALPGRVDMRDGAYVDHGTLNDLYTVWFLTGWRPSEIAALRFDWLSFTTQTAQIRAGRSPRRDWTSPGLMDIR